VAIAFLAWPAGRGRHLGEYTQHDLDAWFGTGPTTRRHVITFLSWARQQRIIRELEVPVISIAAAETCPPGPDRAAGGMVPARRQARRGGRMRAVMACGWSGCWRIR
jgi:hypothetical protein